ncbi:MAG: serpin family protein [Chloroflexi bacterium]|nr:MAG: serpin family protein [Chloroflexota bacterium]
MAANGIIGVSLACLGKEKMMNKRLYVLFTAVIIPALLLSACGSGKVAESKLERVSNPDVDTRDLEQLVAGNTAFAFDLYQAVRPSNGNVVYSPYSISLAFAMAYGGARGEMAIQIADVFHYTLSGDQFHPAFNALDLDLARRPDQAAGVDEKERFQLSIANALWGQDGWPFLPEYLDLLAANYGSGMRLVDFENVPESARRQINDWVSDQTRKRIKDIIPPGMIDPSTRLVLANAIYFKATWEHEFDPKETSDEPFYLLDGDTVSVPMMGMETGEDFAYATGDGWQAVALPYKGGLTEMVVIVPDAGNFETFESALTAERYEEILAKMESQEVILSMPKFTFETQYGLKDVLAGMGMLDAFDPHAADFSGIDGQRDLVISDAIHKAFIAVDEKGTEAAAATVVFMGMGALMPEGIVLTIDRPFFYVIRDIPSGTILFMGRVVDSR